MYTGKSYKLSQFIVWTRQSIYQLIIFGVVPVLVYELADIKWIAIPWTIVALLGTATAFIVGFKNTQTYNRTSEALDVWYAILNFSRSFGVMSRDFVDDPLKVKEILCRHLAWVTSLRYQMREQRIWESTEKKHNAEFQRFYNIPEKRNTLEAELIRYIAMEEIDFISSKSSRSAQLLSLQSKALADIFSQNKIAVLPYADMQKTIREFFILQGKSEKIKNSPYPRQYAIVNTILVKSFCFLLPYGMLREFDKLNEAVSGFMQGNMIWLTIPFSVLISWMYTSLGQVGESTENPFEGNANDVPISAISRIIEIDLLEMIDEHDIPKYPHPVNEIII